MVSIIFQTSPPGAGVYLDSMDTLKITPVTIDIDEGDHTYMLRLTGYQDIAGQFTVTAGNSYVLNAVMQSTDVSMQQQFNENLVQLGWAGVAVAAVGIVISLIISMRSKKGA